MLKSILPVLLVYSLNLFSHCQMPCGIYHDQMMYDKVDEYQLTMFKAMSVLDDNKFETPEDKNKFIRWVMVKEQMSAEIAEIITSYFLQQKIAPAKDEDTTKLVQLLHEMLFQLVKIKQQVNVEAVEDFGKQWDSFKELFHPDMDCETRWKDAFEKYQNHTHDHDHEHGHEH